MTIDTHAEPPELILRLPARVTANGTIERYAQEYRLGSQLPQSTAPLLDPLDTDPA